MYCSWLMYGTKTGGLIAPNAIVLFSSSPSCVRPKPTTPTFFPQYQQCDKNEDVVIHIKKSRSGSFSLPPLFNCLDTLHTVKCAQNRTAIPTFKVGMAVLFWAHLTASQRSNHFTESAVRAAMILCQLRFLLPSRYLTICYPVRVWPSARVPRGHHRAPSTFPVSSWTPLQLRYSLTCLWSNGACADWRSKYVV